MRAGLIVGIALLGVSQLTANDVVLKDGRKLQWRILTDQGDTIEIENASGQRISVKKEDVDLVTVSGSPSAPLTGASFAFDKKRKTVIANLLMGLDAEKGAVSGEWKLGKQGLTGTSGAARGSKFETSFQYPEEYDLAIEVTRTDGEGDFDIGLVAGTRQFLVTFDSNYCTTSGIDKVDGKPVEPPYPSIVRGKFFVNGKPRAIVCMVRKHGLVVQVDGKDFLSYSESWSKLSLNPAHAVPSLNSPFFVIWRGTFTVSRMTATFAK